MVKHIKRLSALALFLTLFLYSCNGSELENAANEVKEKPLFTFAVAGHVYGDPDNYTQSIYPPFLKKLKEDHKKHPFEFLFLTGDVVGDSSEATCRYVNSQLDSLGINWFIAPGNHDQAAGFMPQGDLFQESCGLFCDVVSFSRDRSAFLVLNTSNPGWTIDSREQEVLASLLMTMDSTDNIFVFTHQLWWERNTPAEFQLDSLQPNSFELVDGSSDFWQDAFLYFEQTGIETWFFAGDMGAYPFLWSYYEDHFEHFHFYGSGMGGGEADNYLIVEVYQNGRVDIEKVNF